MKKTIIGLLALLSWGWGAQAQNITVADVEALSEGGTVQLTLHVSGVTGMTSTHFEIALPDGFTVSEVSATSDWTALFSHQGGVVGAISTTANALNGEGDVATITVTVAPGTAVGTYPATVGNIRINGQTLDTTVNFNINVVERHSVVLDENSTTAPTASDGDVDILVKRTINANEWSTICLPFAMTGSQVTAAFGEDVRLMDFVSYESTYDDDDNVTQIIVQFDDVNTSDGMEANHPYIIKTSANIGEFTVTSTLEPDEEDAVIEYDNGKTGKRREVYGWFSGNYTAQKTLESNTLFLSENKFWYSKGLTKMKAYRANFEFVDVLTDVENASARISFAIDEKISTGIQEIQNGENTVGGIYTIQGQYLGRDLSHRQLPQGIYIINGKKHIVKQTK